MTIKYRVIKARDYHYYVEARYNFISGWGRISAAFLDANTAIKYAKKHIEYDGEKIPYNLPVAAVVWSE